MNWQERAEKAEDVLRSLASFVGAGGYNADKVDADVFEQKTRWGIGQIMERLEKAEAELARLAKQEPVVRIDSGYTGGCVTGYLRKGVDANTVVGKQLFTAPVSAVAAPAVPDAKTAGIIKRLRDACPAGSGCKCTVNDAASELERLSALLQSTPQSGSEPVAHHPV